MHRLFIHVLSIFYFSLVLTQNGVFESLKKSICHVFDKKVEIFWELCKYLHLFQWLKKDLSFLRICSDLWKAEEEKEVVLLVCFILFHVILFLLFYIILYYFSITLFYFILFYFASSYFVSVVHLCIYLFPFLFCCWKIN